MASKNVRMDLSNENSRSNLKDDKNSEKQKAKSSKTNESDSKNKQEWDPSEYDQLEPRFFYSYFERQKKENEKLKRELTKERIKSESTRSIGGPDDICGGPPVEQTQIEKECSELNALEAAKESLNSEFIYYLAVLKDITPTMSKRNDKKKLFAWIKKLNMPAYFTSPLALKRNLYLLQLVIMCLNDETCGILSFPPPCGFLPPLEEWCPETALARWEKNTFWDDLFKAAIDEIDDTEDYLLPCSIHGDECEGNSREPQNQQLAGALLDQEFKFFLYLIQPFLTLIKTPEDKLKIALWLQVLSRVQTCSCSEMKGIRNDYMQALIGYVQDLRVTGPFAKFPMDDYLQPLSKEADKLSGHNCWPFISPTSNDAEEFLSMQPKPTNGAFCYIAVCGETEDFDVSGPFSKKRAPPFQF